MYSLILLFPVPFLHDLSTSTALFTRRAKSVYINLLCPAKVSFKISLFSSLVKLKRSIVFFLEDLDVIS